MRPPSSLTRRAFGRTVALSAAAPFLVGLSRGGEPVAEVLETRVISDPAAPYAGWPTVARRKGGELWVTFSGGREAHVCPFGQVQAMKSVDGGNSWTTPRVLLDGPLDDRDAGVVETAAGSLVVTTFSSLAYEDAVLSHPEKTKAWPEEKRKRWEAARDWLPADERQAELGEWALRSTDGGRSWSAPIPTLVNSPHGPVALKDGRLLYAGKQLWTAEKKVGVAESADDGQTWRWLADIPVPPGVEAGRDWHELHAVEAADGTVIVHIRSHAAPHAGETLQCESRDGGRTWTEPHAIGVWGLPSHLLHLRDGRLLMTYGHRRAPFGNQARLSTDHGRTWSGPLVISADGTNGDLGYPSTVELGDDGTLLTVWYEALTPGSKAVLRQARWRLR